MLIAQTTQPAADTLPNWAVGILAALAGVVAILTFVQMFVMPLVKDLIKQVVDAVAEARAAQAKTDATQKSVDRVASGLHAAQVSIANVAAQAVPQNPPAEAPPVPREHQL